MTTTESAATTIADGEAARFTLGDGSRVAVIGGGPAGSFFSYFFLEAADRVGLETSVDIYEAKSFDQTGPAGCNMCGGIVSESLVQLLATEGINLPPTVVQRGIDSYVLHMDVGSARLDPPGHEKRIAAVHRGCGPRGSHSCWQGFDGHVLGLAREKGAQVIPSRVDSIAWHDGKPRIVTRKGESDDYDLVVVATGVNGGAAKFLGSVGLGYEPPKTTKTYICELPLGLDQIQTFLGSSMHVFLLNLPRLEFGALIPKGEYVTLVLLGSEIDKDLVASFLGAPEVRAVLPPGWEMPEDFCRCYPSINVAGPAKPFADRIVVIGDSGESRLYKDGIGGAYRTAKAAAKTAVLEGVSEENFRQHFLPTCRSLSFDNKVGKIIFGVTGLIQSLRFTRRGILRMVRLEQATEGSALRMSGVLWDTFTGSAPYRDVFVRTLHPAFIGRLVLDTALGFLPAALGGTQKEEGVRMGELGKVYRPGDVIVRQGDVGESMYIIQSGRVEVVRESDGAETRLGELGEGDFFGEMALVEKDVRSATVRAIDEVRAITVDKKIFMRKVHEDPSLAFRIMQRMSRRIKDLSRSLAEATGGQTPS